MDTKPWEKFVKAHKLKTAPEGNGEDVVALGKLGQIYQYDDDSAGAMYIPHKPRKGWKIFGEKLLALGATIVQDADMEGAVIFRFDNNKALRTACSLLKVRSKRSLSPEKRVILAARLTKARAAKHA